MGAFYGSVQVRSENRDVLRSALEKLSRKKKRFLLGPPLNGWVGIYPEGIGQEFRVARDLSRRLPDEIVATVVHDDDILAYEYYRDGKRIDRYNSVPDYFGEVSEMEKRDLRGRPETFAHLATDRAKFKVLVNQLARQPEQRAVFASVLLEEFADALGIRNALTSYECLKENEETDDIEGWDQFVQVPDLRDELAKQQAAEDAIRKKKQDLIQKGRLLAERAGILGWASPSPWWCPAPDGRGFLVTWSSHADSREGSLPIELHGPPWTSGPVATPWSIGPHVYGLELSPSGRYLAVAHAAGDWKAGVWDLVENRLVAEAPQVHAVSSVGFMPDESAMYSVSSQGEEGGVVITPIGAGEPHDIPINYAKLAAPHPSGSWLVVIDDLNRLLIIDIATGRVERTHFVGGRSAAGSMIDIDTLEQQVRQQQDKLLEMFEKTGLPPGIGSIEELKRQFEDTIVKMREGYVRPGMQQGQSSQERGSERVFRLRFDPPGKRLCLATMAGVRVCQWHEILNADGDLPPSALAVDTRGTPVDADGGSLQRNGYVYDLDYDLDRDRLLFAGLDGRVRFLDFLSGRSGVVLEPPTLPPILRVALSRDRTTLALTSYPDMFARSRNKRGPLLQFWDYQAINHA
jgi:WD40 repeat protein